MDYDSGRTIDYSYDSGNGKLDSIDFSDLGEYLINYSATTGNISSITYPNSAGTESYTNSGGLGRISAISYPGNKELAFTWNDKNQITRLEYNDYNAQTIVIYALTYNHAGKIAGYTKSEDSIQTANWSFYYGPFGLEKAVRSTSPSITEDFTVDPSGRILSMTYTEAGGFYNGEYFFYYDNFGNTVLLTNSSGEAKYSARYDLQNGKMVEEWNPNGLEWVGKISLKLTNDLTINVFQNSYCEISNIFSKSKITNNDVTILAKFILPVINCCDKNGWCNQPDPGEANRDKNAQTPGIELDKNDIGKNGQLNSSLISQLLGYGFTMFEIYHIGDITKKCEKRGGAKTVCTTQLNNSGISKKGTCCLNCECREKKESAGVAQSGGGGGVTICEDAAWDN